MIGTIDIRVNAAHPNLALAEVCGFVGSPSSVRIANVPERIGTWSLTSVRLVVSYPDNVETERSCVRVNGVWTGTIPAPERAGSVVGGFKVLADGTDENGEPVTGYVLGVGDVRVLNRDNTEGDTSYLLHLHDEKPDEPKKADVQKMDERWKIFNGEGWETFGGLDYKAGEGLALSGDTFSLSATIPSRTSQLSNDSGFITESNIPQPTKLYNAVSAQTDPLYKDQYIVGDQTVYMWQVDDSFTCGDTTLIRTGRDLHWIKYWTAIRIHYDSDAREWLYYPDGYQDPVHTPGLSTDTQVSFVYRSQTMVWDRTINSNWVQKGKLIDTSGDSLRSIIDYESITVNNNGKLQVATSHIPRYYDIWNNSSYYQYGLEGNEVHYLAFWMMESNISSIVDWQSYGQMVYTPVSGMLSAGNTYRITEYYLPELSSEHGYLIFNMQNPNGGG